MPDKYYIKEITDKQDPALEKVGLLFAEMYEYMQGHGLLLKLAPDGSQQWISSISKSLGRFGVLYVIFSDDEVFGFANGSIRLSPDYLGSVKLGVITHIFVRGNERGRGAGRKLVNALEGWFARQNVHSVELQVLSENQPAIGFWKKLGYGSELLQCRKVL